MTRLGGHLSLAAIGLLWGSSSLLIRLIDQTALFITWGRYSFGALTVIAWGLAIRRRDWSLGTRPWLLVGVASWLVVAAASYAGAIKLTTVANAALISFTAPVLVPFLASWILKESVRREALMAIVLALVGVVAVIGPDLHNLDLSSGIGIGLAAVSASGVAGATIGIRLVRRHTPSFNTALYRMLVGSVVLLPFTAASDKLSIDALSLAMLATLGILHTGAAMALFAHVMGYVQAQDAALYNYLEPLSSVLLAALFLGEPISLNAAIGGALVLAAAYMASQPSKSPSTADNE